MTDERQLGAVDAIPGDARASCGPRAAGEALGRRAIAHRRRGEDGEPACGLAHPEHDPTSVDVGARVRSRRIFSVTSELADLDEQVLVGQ